MALIRHNGKARGLWGILLVPSNLAFGTSLSYHLKTGESVHGTFYWCMILLMFGDFVLDLFSTKKHRMETITDWNGVVRHYARGWMIPDIMAAIPFEYLADVFHWEGGWALALRLLPLSKTFKVSTVLSDLQHILQMPRAVVQMKGLIYWGIQAVHAYVDAMAMYMVQDPASIQVIVTCNLFGDILTDIGAALQGGLGMAGSASLHPGKRIGLFEPVHGSAPPLAGKDVANPFASFLTVGLMMSHLGHRELETLIEDCIRACVQAGECTHDVGGALGTRAASEAFLTRIAARLA
jgi:hypothetical protein